MTTPVGGWTRPAVFLANLIGDQLVSLPAIRAICARCPSRVQLLLGEGLLSFFYQGLPIGPITRVWYDDAEPPGVDVDRTAAAAGPCDLFLSLARRAGATALARRMGAVRLVGILDGADDSRRARAGEHAFDTLFSIAQQLDPALRFDDFNGPPILSSAARSAAARMVTGWRRPGERLLFVHPETKAAKMWRPEGYSRVLTRFLARHPECRVIVSSLEPSGIDLPAARVEYSSHHLELTMAMMAHMDAFLGVDSCFLHAADMCRVPGVGLFGPTTPAQWGFRISPTFRHVAADTTAAIARDDVLDALESIVNW